MKEIKVPELAESITEGTIAEWLVQKGDQVEKGDPILELETDKVNVEVNADASGVISELLKEAGDDVEVGDVIAKVDENGEAGGSSEEESSNEEEQKESSEENKQAEEDKEQQQETEDSKQKEESKSDQDQGSNDDDKKEVIATPAARKRARELGINLSEISARDPLGRIRPEDVEEAAQGGGKQEQKQEPKQEQKKEAPKKEKKSEQNSEKTEFEKPVERVKMSRRRQTIAKRLVEVQQTSAMLTTFNEVDMTNVMNLRSQRKESFQKKHDIKLGFMSFFTKAVVGALKEFPLINAEIQGNEIVMKKFYDIGMAVSTEEGLVVPVVRDADRLDFAGIEKGIADVATKARNKELQLEDLQGGSFTITNGGIFGSMLSTPILNSPQVGILGLHNIEKRPKVMPDDTIQARPMMYIALSYDHRIVDGKEAVQFLKRIKEMIEDPYDLLLEG